MSYESPNSKLRKMLADLERVIIPAWQSGGVPMEDMRSSLLDLYALRRAARRPGSGLRRLADDIQTQLERITF